MFEVRPNEIKRRSYKIYKIFTIKVQHCEHAITDNVVTVVINPQQRAALKVTDTRAKYGRAVAIETKKFEEHTMQITSISSLWGRSIELECRRRFDLPPLRFYWVCCSLISTGWPHRPAVIRRLVVRQTIHAPWFIGKFCSKLERKTKKERI